MMEGTGKYFLLLFLIYLIVYITVKICLANLFKRAKEQSYKAYIPIYCKYVLVKMLNLKKSVFVMSLIPIVNLHYYNIIIKKLLEGFGQNPNESTLYLLFPMYKFPELVFKKPKYLNNEYDLTEGFLESQDILFNQKEGDSVQEAEKNIVNNLAGTTVAKDNINVIAPLKDTKEENTPWQENNDVINNITPLNESVQTKPLSEAENTPWSVQEEKTTEVKEERPKEQSLFDMRNKEASDSDLVKENKITNETYFEAKPQEEKQKPAMVALETGRPKVCPNCGAKLSPNATTCFLCGHKLN